MLPTMVNSCTTYLNILLTKKTAYILKKMEEQRSRISLKLRWEHSILKSSVIMYYYKKQNTSVLLQNILNFGKHIKILKKKKKKM